jgi:hypothetical protein
MKAWLTQCLGGCMKRATRPGARYAASSLGADTADGSAYHHGQGVTNTTEDTESAAASQICVGDGH